MPSFVERENSLPVIMKDPKAIRETSKMLLPLAFKNVSENRRDIDKPSSLVLGSTDL
jgi:hypothetical protein